MVRACRKVLEVSTVLGVDTFDQAPVIFLQDGHITCLFLLLEGEGRLVGDGGGIYVRSTEGHLTDACDKDR